jgi:murein DD-endopeptidase MepM/ murein hydrolase activator NlpD
MRTLWRNTALVALLCGTAGACATPHYPIDEGGARGAAPLSAPKPRYPIDEAQPAPTPAAAPAAPQAEPPPTAAPVPSVSSEPLAPPQASPAQTSPSAPGPSAANARSAGARLELANYSTQADASAPSPTPTGQTAAPASDRGAAAPAAPPASVPEPALTPQMVVHDQPAASTAATPPAPAPGMAYAEPPPVRASATRSIAGGGVVRASGRIFERYEVQRGDHVDALARAFDTSREVILSANHMRAPYVIHPGDILKVPVARAYVARSGDTLSQVARRFSVNVDELAQLNHLSERATLRDGEEIGLPSSMRDRGPIRETEYVDRPRDRYAYAAPYRTSYAAPPSTPRMRPDTGLANPPTAGYAAPPPSAAAEATMSDGDIAKAAQGRFVWPVKGEIVQRFGLHGVARNDGVDIKAAQGTQVIAAAPGEVVYAGDQVPGYGNLVLIKHSDGWVTAYAHLDSVEVKNRQQVAQGQQLGSVGMSGGATEPELHFEVRFAQSPTDKAKPVDPVLVLPTG